MSQTSLINGRVRGTHLGGVSFSLYSIPHVPTALILDDGSACLETRSLHASPESAFDFINRTCTPRPKPICENTRWSQESILDIATSRFHIAVLKIGQNHADQMSFRMQGFYPNGDNEPEVSLRAEIEYQSPAFYLFQLAEFALVKTNGTPIVNGGVASTLIAGNAALFGYIADRYGILRHGEIKLEDATTLSKLIKNEGDKKTTLIMTQGGCAYLSASRGYGFGCDGLPNDNAPDVAVKFSEKGANILAMNGENLPLQGPSIAVLQNMSIAPYELHDNVIPLVKDLVLAAAYMCPTLPLRHSA